MRKNLLLLLSLISVAATAHQATGQSAGSSTLKGVETADIDASAAPCDNFFDYANGAWRKANPIPASMGKWSRRWQAGEHNKDQLKDILDSLAAKTDQPAGSAAQLTGDFYAACTNSQAIDARGVEPLKPLLAAIDAVHDHASLEEEIRELRAIDIAAPVALQSFPNPHKPSANIADFAASGLGLPDRDYYLKPEQRFADARAGYLVYVARVFVLAGSSEADAKASAETVMRFETALAKASLDNVALRDPNSIDHATDLAGLEKMAPHFDWKAYFAAAHVTPGGINVEQPGFVAEFERQLKETPLADWKTYLRWRVINSASAYLSQPFVDARFDFFQKQLAGVGELKPRSLRCAEQADELLPDPIGQEYVRRYFPPEAKERAQAMVANIRSSMRETIEKLDWMTPPTKKKALEKLSTFEVKVGYPDKWRDFSKVKITRDHYFEDVLAATRFRIADDAAQINKPVDRERWEMTAPTSDASYNPLLNAITFPAGILQPPAFSVNASDAVNYGAIGVVIGHEISHGFDDEGAQFDAQGRLENWWTPEDLSKFQAKTACVVHQFDNFKIDGPENIHINGKLVLGESIGDLAGLKIAYLAFKKTPQGQSKAMQDGFTPDQQFFIAWGQFRGDETRPETQKMMVQGDPHPIAKYRVIGPMQNFAPFEKAFSCKQGAAMTRPDAERCIVW